MMTCFPLPLSEYYWIGTSWVSNLQQFQWVDGSLWSINNAIFPYKRVSEPDNLEAYDGSSSPYQNCIYFVFTKIATKECSNKYQSLCQPSTYTIMYNSVCKFMFYLISSCSATTNWMIFINITAQIMKECTWNICRYWSIDKRWLYSMKTFISSEYRAYTWS